MDALKERSGLRQRPGKQKVATTPDVDIALHTAFSDTLLVSQSASTSTSSMTEQNLYADNANFNEISRGEGPSQNDSSLETKVFLSYSGAQKSFAEALFEEMKNAGYFPFFDQACYSLPKGEPFAKLIIQNAKICRVAVVVLTENYLCSKWPMLELALFVNARRTSNPKMKILPLFYECEVSFLKDEESKKRRQNIWQHLADNDPRINVNEWAQALEEVLKINGHLVLRGRPEVEYMRKIMKSLSDLCPPDLGFQLLGMKGEQGLCKVVADKLEKKLEEGETAVLGLHGVGGMGKTLICKALCNHFRARFVGRVLYVDFSDGKSLELKKKIIGGLTKFKSGKKHSRTDLDSMQEQQVDGLLTEHLHREDVFLAIDNLSDALNLPEEILSKGSMLVVTSRSNKCFETLRGMHISQISMPTLTEDEAMELFICEALLHWPSPSSGRKRFKTPITAEGLEEVFTTEELQVLKTCVSRCVIRDNMSLFVDLLSPTSHSYHPMALKALGKYLAGVINPPDPLEWARQEEIPEINNLNSVGTLDSIYEIFEKVYDNNDMMDATDKLIFMDVAVFAPREKLWHLDHLCAWLKEIFSDIHEKVIERKLKKLEKLGFLEINESWSNQGGVRMHDLYKDFAHWKLKEEPPKKMCVYHTDGKSLPFWLESTPPHGFWPDLRRIKLQTSQKDSSEYLLEGIHEIVENFVFFKFPEEKIREWKNVQVLDLAFGGERIDIGPLQCLRDLRLKADQSLRTFDCSGELKELRFVKFICWEGEVRHVLQHPNFKAPQLQHLEMKFNLVELERPLTLPLQCHALTILKVSKWHSAHHQEELNFQHLPNLTDLEIISDTIFHGSCTLSLSGLSALTKLKRMYFRALPFEGPFLGLENLISLEILVLRLCFRVTALPGLGALTNLQHLSVSGTEVNNLTGLDNLSVLGELYCLNCGRLQSLPDLSSMQHLFIVNTTGCDLLDQDILVSASCLVVPWERESIQEQRERLLPLIAAGYEPILAKCFQDAVRMVRIFTSSKPELAKYAEAELENLMRVMMDPRTIAREEARIERVANRQKQFEWAMTFLKLLAYVIGCLAAEYFHEKYPLENIILPWLGMETGRSHEDPGTNSVFSSWQKFGYCLFRILLFPVLRILNS